ncbi:hypothetical protein ACFW16_32660 [Inquilinus sp. NPDC058860]|uniref:hypothetical protein n=1 Tax=Inquilinus sp. NPDC058860 TaxID=3346652 RepID=UPI0036B98671
MQDLIKRLDELHSSESMKAISRFIFTTIASSIILLVSMITVGLSDKESAQYVFAPILFLMIFFIVIFGIAAIVVYAILLTYSWKSRKNRKMRNTVAYIALATVLYIFLMFLPVLGVFAAAVNVGRYASGCPAMTAEGILLNRYNQDSPDRCDHLDGM